MGRRHTQRKQAMHFDTVCSELQNSTHSEHSAQIGSVGSLCRTVLYNVLCCTKSKFLCSSTLRWTALDHFWCIWTYMCLLTNCKANIHRVKGHPLSWAYLRRIFYMKTVRFNCLRQEWGLLCKTKCENCGRNTSFLAEINYRGGGGGGSCHSTVTASAIFN